MTTFEKIKEGIPDGINIPGELQKLCEWTDANGYPISGEFELRADDGETMRYWLGTDVVSHRFGLFGAGSDGSIFAFWLDDEGQQKIVHLGSEGSSRLILADNFVDFLRLLAIGYDAVGFADLNMTLQEWNLEGYRQFCTFMGKEKSAEQLIADLGDKIDEGYNPDFVAWVQGEFGVDIPQKGQEIVRYHDRSLEHWIDAIVGTCS